MTTCSQEDDLVARAAEAIIEAEWLRLLLDDHTLRNVDGDVSDEETARRTTVSHFDIGAQFVGRPDATPITHRGNGAVTGCPPQRVWATQRSPP